MATSTSTASGSSDDSRKRELLHFVTENAEDCAAFTINRDGRITDWNLGGKAIFGYSTRQIIGRRITLLYPRSADNPKRFQQFLSSKRRTKQCEGWWLRKDRSKFWGQCVYKPLDAMRGACGFAVLIRDLTSSAHAGDDARLLASIVESSDDAIIGKDLNGKVLNWNDAAERLFGYRRAEMVGKPITLLIPPTRLAEEAAILRRVRRGERVDHFETDRVRKDGQQINVSISVSPIRGPDGRIVGASKIARDITERKRAEEARHRGERFLQAILDTATDAIITINERGLIHSVNPATEQLFGFTPAELIGQNINRLMPDPYHGEHDRYLRNYCRTGRAKIIGIGREVTGLRKDGSTFPMHLSVSEVKLKGQRLFTGIVHDLTERRRLERQIMEATANEQRRIGQDLHDGLCQDLIGIAFGIDAIIRNLPPGSDRDPVAKLAASVRDAAGQARRLAHGLNPVDLKAGGLPTALENLATKVADSFSIHCTFHWDRIVRISDDATATHLYRIAQEAVGNAIRHGKARNVKLSLKQQRGSVVLSIADNGRGMPEPAVDAVKQGLAVSTPQRSLPIGIGLQTMQYRARILGGTLAVMSRKGRGTTVTCTINRIPSVLPSGKSDKASGNTSPAKRARPR